MKRIVVPLVIIIVLGVVSYLLFNNNPPDPIVTVKGDKIEVVQGSYCWRGFINAECVDMISPPDIIKHEELKPFVVSPGEKMLIEFKKEPKKNTLVVNIWINNEETESVSISDNVLLAPKEKGIYVYDVSARWERGSSSYAFVIVVE